MSMELKPEFVFNPGVSPAPAGPTGEPAILAGAAPVTGALASDAGPADELGPIAGLLGTWKGEGFNQIWRPFHDPANPSQDRFLMLNRTVEQLAIEEVKGAIPNRGLLQPDINMFGLHYLQQISDFTTGEALHFEPGIWLNIPLTTDPAVPPTVARLGSIPHGTTVLMQGIAKTTQGRPTIAPVSITPFLIGHPSQQIPFPESDLSQSTVFRTPDLEAAGVTQGMVDDPNSVLRDAIAGQTIKETTTLVITSLPQPVAGGGTANTAFLQGLPGGAPNADAAVSTAIFWIETVQGENGDFVQLQYTQTVLLDFAGLSWPHVSVATLQLVSADV